MAGKQHNKAGRKPASEALSRAFTLSAILDENADDARHLESVLNAANREFENVHVNDEAARAALNMTHNLVAVSLKYARDREPAEAASPLGVAQWRMNAATRGPGDEGATGQDCSEVPPGPGWLKNLARYNRGARAQRSLRTAKKPDETLVPS
jgi:hypothetical protein